MSGRIGLIGGSGLYDLDSLNALPRIKPDTPYGEVSAELVVGEWQDLAVAFLPRHGNQHQIAPHRINYRANIKALQDCGVSHIIAVNAVGGISSNMAPGTLVLPHQIIDYSHGREQTFSDQMDEVLHIDFSDPYSQAIRNQIVNSAENLNIELQNGSIYGCTNGPRFETSAEIQRMARDGCDLVGMTGMPEAVLARELGIEYASISLVVNWAAGIVQEPIEMDDIMHTLKSGMETVKPLLLESLRGIKNELL